MANRDIVAIGTSAGGVEALLYLAKALPRNFPASVLVTIHLSGQFRSSLDELLTRSGPLPATFAGEGDPLRKGHIYLAPPGRHLIVEAEGLSLGVGPRENNVRPAIDPMLRSLALCCGTRGIGVVLTGTLGDGASGLWALSQSGGITVVQDPHDAAFPEMPMTALDRMRPDHVARLADVPRLLEALVQQPAGPAGPVPCTLKYEVQVARTGQGSMEEMDRIGRRSVLTCPDCDGVMWEIDEGDLVRYRCHIGHAYTAELMALALDENLRRALGSALRTIEERVALMEKLRRQAVASRSPLVSKTWDQMASELEEQAQVIRDTIRRMEELVETANADQPPAVAASQGRT